MPDVRAVAWFIPANAGRTSLREQRGSGWNDSGTCDRVPVLAAGCAASLPVLRRRLARGLWCTPPSIKGINHPRLIGPLRAQPCVPGLTRYATAAKPQDAMRRQRPTRRGYARRSGQRSLTGRSTVLTSFTLLSSPFSLPSRRFHGLRYSSATAAGHCVPPVWPPRLVGFDSNVVRCFLPPASGLQPPASLAASMATQSVPSMAPRGVMAAPSMSPHGSCCRCQTDPPRNGRSASNHVPPLDTANSLPPRPPSGDGRLSRSSRRPATLRRCLSLSLHRRHFPPSALAAALISQKRLPTPFPVHSFSFNYLQNSHPRGQSLFPATRP